MKKDFTKNLLLEQLRKVPIIQVACEKVGVSRGSYYKWTREDVEFGIQCQEAILQGIDYVNDLTENQLLTLIGEKRMQAISMWLKHNNPRYGAKMQPRDAYPSMENMNPDDPKYQKIKLITQQYEKDLREAIVEKINEKNK